MTTDSDRNDVDRGAARAASPPTGSSGSTKALIGMLLAGAVGLVIFLFVHLSRDGGIRPGPTPAHAECTKGQRDCLPDVSYTDTSGVAYSREALAGKVVLVNFWATWCHPCQAEIPALSKIYDKYKSRGVVFLGVLTDAPDSQQLLNFQSDHNMTYPVVRANRQLMSSFEEPSSLPTTFVYSRGGKQVFNRIGALRESELDSLVGTLVAQQ
jgi:thiol-disulfide isomerase/thioredoxin